MGALPLLHFLPRQSQRAEGLIIGASAGAAAARGSGDPAFLAWPDPETVLLHAARGCMEHGRFISQDLIRRLVADWAVHHGPGQSVLREVTHLMPRQASGFIAAMAPICLRARGRSGDAQRPSATFLDQSNINLAYTYTEQPVVTETQASVAPRCLAACVKDSMACCARVGSSADSGSSTRNNPACEASARARPASFPAD